MGAPLPAGPNARHHTPPAGLSRTASPSKSSQDGRRQGGMTARPGRPCWPALLALMSGLATAPSASRFAGCSIHYFRIHPAYWRDRLERSRAMGLNAIEVPPGRPGRGKHTRASTQ